MYKLTYSIRDKMTEIYGYSCGISISYAINNQIKWIKQRSKKKIRKLNDFVIEYISLKKERKDSSIYFADRYWK